MERNWNDLVTRAGGGDQEAWAELYEATKKEVYFVALKVLGREDEAADLVQDAYVTAFQRLGQLENPEKFRSWLNIIVANRCRDHLKKHRPMLFSELEQDDGPPLDWADEREYAAPDRKLDHKETVRLVAEMIEGLPEDQRLCVILYYREGLSVGEIAAVLEVSEGTVKSRLNYARKKIKISVEKLEKEGVKLYGLAPIPFLLWLLRGEAEATAVPPALSAGTAGTAGAGASSGAAGSGLVSGVKAAAAGGLKKLAGSTAAKALAGVLAAGVVVTGGAVLLSGDEPVKPAEQPVSPSASVSAPAAESPLPEELKSLENGASEAYLALLSRGVTDRGLTIRYYTLLDMDKDNVPELLVANNSGNEDVVTVGELYRYRKGCAEYICTMSTWNTCFYLHDEQYLVGEDLSLTARERELWASVDGRLETVPNRWKIRTRLYLKPNQVGEEQVYHYGNDYFTALIPLAWLEKGTFREMKTDTGVMLCIYESENTDGIPALSVWTVPLDENTDCCHVIGISAASGGTLQVIASGPQDLWYDPEDNDPWQKMAIDADWFYSNVRVR